MDFGLGNTSDGFVEWSLELGQFSAEMDIPFVVEKNCKEN